MAIFDATAPASTPSSARGRSSECFRFGNRAEADAAADLLRGAGCGITWIVRAEGRQRCVTIPED